MAARKGQLESLRDFNISNAIIVPSLQLIAFDLSVATNKEIDTQGDLRYLHAFDL